MKKPDTQETNVVKKKVILILSFWLGRLSCVIVLFWFLVDFIVSYPEFKMLFIIAFLPSILAILFSWYYVRLFRKEKKRVNIFAYKGMILGILGIIILFLTIFVPALYTFARERPDTYIIRCIILVIVVEFIIGRISIKLATAWHWLKGITTKEQFLKEFKPFELSHPT